MNIKKIPVGSYQCNCYILTKDNNALLIDPGDEYDKIKKELLNYHLEGILITHHHFDHVGALKYFKEKIYDYSNLKEQEYFVGNFKFEVIYTPGHTEDSITFYFKEDNLMFTGDFLFLKSIGRTDLGGNINDMKLSIEKIKKYSDCVICPGHGDKTTLNYEKDNNMFF